MKIDFRTCFSIGALALVSGLASPAHAAIVETYEAPGLTNTTTLFNGGYGVENFDGKPASGGFTTPFGASSSYAGTYSAGVRVSAADPVGGAGGTGSYAVTFSGSSYSLTLNQKATYFGFWLSAADAGNIVAFYSGQSLLGSIRQSKVGAAIGGNAAYYGNPSSKFQGQNGTEPYAFVNFYDTDQTGFDRIVFSQDGVLGGGFETDNHTVGRYASVSGSYAAMGVAEPGAAMTVPEPGSWALVVVALAGVGTTTARRKATRT